MRRRLQSLLCIVVAIRDKSSAVAQMAPQCSTAQTVKNRAWNMYVGKWLLILIGVTRVGVTRGGNWGCHPYFSWKKRDLFLLIAVTFIDFTRVSTAGGCHPHLFYLSDLVYPLFFVNLPTNFSLGCHPLEGVTRGGPSPLVTPLLILVYKPIVIIVVKNEVGKMPSYLTTWLTAVENPLLMSMLDNGDHPRRMMATAMRWI